MCIESVLIQSCTDWELILVDDGSPDNAGAICIDYASKDPRIKVIHKSNGGVSSARNLGLNNMTGDWVMFLDADDMIAPETLEVCLDALQRDNLDMVQFSYTRKLNWGGNDGKDTIVQTSKCYIDSGVAQTFVACSIIRASLICDLRFNERLNLAEDQLFIMSCINESQRIKRLGNQLYFYRVNTSSATKRASSADIINSVYALLDFRQNYDEWSRYINRNIISMIKTLTINNDVGAARIKKIFSDMVISRSTLRDRSSLIYFFLAKISIYLITFLQRAKYLKIS